MDVLQDHFIGDIARTGDVVTARPEVLAPVAFAEFGEFLLDLPRRGPFAVLDQFGWCEVGRGGDEEMDVARRDASGKNRDFVFRTDQSNEVSHPNGDLAGQNGVAVLRDPDDMVFQVILGVGGLPQMLHPAMVARAEAFA